MKSIKQFIDGHRTAFFAVLCLFGLCLLHAAGVTNKKTGGKADDDRIYLIHADELLYNRFSSGLARDAQIVRGGVIFEHQGGRLTCDSAYYYQARNSVIAMGHVRYHDAEDLTLTCDSASYDGNSPMPVFRAFSKADNLVHYIKGDTLSVECKTATYTTNQASAGEKKLEARDNVKLVHKGRVLRTDNLNYLRNAIEEKAWFFEGGRMDDGKKYLSSDWGAYYMSSEKADFYFTVKMRNDKWFVTSDTLHYDAKAKRAHVVGPTTIRNDKDGTIVSTTDAFFNSESDGFQMFNRSVIRDSINHRRIEADSLFYDKKTGVNEGFGQVVYIDTLKMREMYGDYVYHNDITGESSIIGSAFLKDNDKIRTLRCDSIFANDSTGLHEGFGNVHVVDSLNKNEMLGNYFQYNKITGYGYATDDAWGMDYSQKDTLYVRADTMKVFTYNIDTDSVYRELHCYKNVRAYRVDLQAVCDSLMGSSRDSSLTMYQDPVVWNDNRQILGEYIKVFMNDSTIREAHVVGQALSIEKVDEEDHYNQIASKVLDAYFDDEGQLRHTVATGNVKVLFYPTDDKTDSLMFLDHTLTDTLHMYLSAERQLEKIRTNKHESVLYPMTQIPPDMYKLEEFVLFDDLRPKNKEDIFVIRKKSEDQQLKIVERTAIPLQYLDAPPSEEEAPDDSEPDPETEEPGESMPESDEGISAEQVPTTDETN